LIIKEKYILKKIRAQDGFGNYDSQY